MLAIPIILTIGTSDNLGGAGVQADLKTTQALGCYGVGVLVAITAQIVGKDIKLDQIFTVPTSFIKRQIRNILKSMHVKVVKVGMLPNLESIEAVSAILKKYHKQFQHIIIDPILTDSKHQVIFKLDIIKAIKEKIIPWATLVTPNLIEGELIFGSINNNFQQWLRQLPCKALIKVGTHKHNNLFIYNTQTNQQNLNITEHKKNRINTSNQELKFEINKFPTLDHNAGLMLDICWDGYQVWNLYHQRYPHRYIRGDGCILSAAIAAKLAIGKTLVQSIIEAKNYVKALIKDQLIIMN